MYFGATTTGRHLPAATGRGDSRRKKRKIMEEDNSRLLREAAAQLGISLTPEQIRLFDIYLKELKTWSVRTNLISRKNDREIILKDFIDSLTIVKHISTGASLADLGSGAGLPGIPVKIVRPDLEMILIEARQKRTSFLKHMVRVLGLTGIDVLRPEGKETDIMERPEKFDFVVSRAFGPLRKLSSAAGRLVATGGTLLAMKGKEGEKELQDNLEFLEEEGWEKSFVERSLLPILNHERVLIGLKKKGCFT